MWFSALYVCSACRLRQVQQARCRCGGTTLLSLRTQPGQSLYRSAAQGRSRRFPRLFAALASNGKSGPVIGLGLLFCMPALYTWMVQGALAPRAVTVLLVGLAVVALGLVARLQTGRQASALDIAPAPPRANDTTTLRGVARLATISIVSALAERPCLVFGVRGTAGHVRIADADGGDFDLELPSGERVAISLEHAFFEPRDDEPPRELTGPKSTVLEELFEHRAIDPEGRSVQLAEDVILEGDDVLVEGTLQRGGLVAFGPRGAAAQRVLGGTADAPLRLRLDRTAAT